VYVRWDSSDPEVFRQIFIDRQYSYFDHVEHIGLVIDCGANVGYSAAYFLSTHPAGEVIAVEPDPTNFATLRPNLSAYGHRVTLLQAGIWSHKTRLCLSQEAYRDGRDWTRQVTPCGDNAEGSFEGIDISSILASSGYDRVSLLKMDIEGAEAVVFSAPDLSWLEKVDAIAIELHDDSVFGNASEVFHAALRGRGFHVAQKGELTICGR
jgi:FkbM family methyltransferase